MNAPVFAVVTTCFDRWDFLRQSLPTWRGLAGAPPVFVGTYESDEVPDWLEGVHLVRARAQPFELTRLRNCVATAARETLGPDWLVFVDSDIRVLDGDVFARAVREADEAPDYVLDSPWAASDNPYHHPPDDPEREEPGIRGSHVVRADFFFEVGGYDGRMIGWAGEDRELYARYVRTSDRVAFYGRGGLEHIEHSDELRERHNPEGLDRLGSALRNLLHLKTRPPVDETEDARLLGFDDVSVSWIPSDPEAAVSPLPHERSATSRPGELEGSAST